jgi:rhamnosyltransferase
MNDSAPIGAIDIDVRGPSATVGVVIRTLNERDLLPTCLQKLREQWFDSAIDIVVVDSGSTDGTLDIAKAAGVRIVEVSPDAFDYSTALNKGIADVGADVVVSLSAHAIPVDDMWLQKMTAPFEDPQVAGVSCRQIPWPDAPWQEVHRLQHAFGTTPASYSQVNADAIIFSNAASAIRRRVWEQEPFALPAVEDLEWARRVVANGFVIVYEPETAVYHSHNENPRAQARRMIDINRVLGSRVPRTWRRTVREAASFFARDSAKIIALDEPVRRKAAYLADLLQTVTYYAVDFSRSGTTAERRREDRHTHSSTR